MHVLCILSTNLTLGIRTKDLHSMVRSRKPVVVLIEWPQPKNMAPTGPPNWKSQNRYCRRNWIKMHTILITNQKLLRECSCPNSQACSQVVTLQQAII